MSRLKSYRVFILLMLFYFPVISRGQIWPKIYGDNFHSLVNDLSEAYDQGNILTAFTYDNQGVPEYGWIIKTDINGNLLWDKKIGNGNYRNWFSSSKITQDNGIIISGSTGKYSSGDNDPVFIKMDVCGEIEWCRTLLSPDQNYGTGIIQLDDGSYIGMLSYYGEGPEYSRISLIKMDKAGEPIWIQRLAQEDSLIYNEEGDYLYMTTDSNYLVSGECFHPGLKPFWIKTDTTGSEIWDLMWQGGVGGAYQVAENNNNYFYSTGGFSSVGRPMTPALFKFDEDGNPQYYAYLLGDTIDGGGAVPVCFYNDTTLLAGIIWGSSPNVIYYSEIFMLDTLGNLLNRRLLLNESRAPESIIKTSDNKILVAGDYVVDGNWDIYLWKLNSDLEFDTLYTQPLTYDSLCPYPITSDTVDLNCDLFVNIDEIPTKEEYETTIQVSPNPAKDWITLSFPENISSGVVELSVYNLCGQNILNKEAKPSNRITSLSVSNLSAGIYFVVGTDSRKQVMKGKFVVAK